MKTSAERRRHQISMATGASPQPPNWCQTTKKKPGWNGEAATMGRSRRERQRMTGWLNGCSNEPLTQAAAAAAAAASLVETQ